MERFLRVRSLRRRTWIGYAGAVVLAGLALTIRMALHDVFIGFPYITFFPVVLITALVGTRGSAILATVLSAGLVGYFLIEPYGAILPSDTSAWVGLAFFFVVSGVIVTLVEWLNDALDRAEWLNQELENRVAARTNDLQIAYTELRREVTQREATESQFLQMQKMEAVGQLTGGLAHDFNNMLAVVIGSLDLAKRRLANNDSDIMRFLDNAMDGARRGAQLTHRLLAFSRQQPLSPVTTDVNTLVRGMEDLLRRSLGEQLKTEFVFGGGIWLTNIDPGQLENAILNLAINARDAMAEGGKLTIETMNAHLDDEYADKLLDVKAGQYVVVAVSDTGSGMPPDVVARAFDPFFTTKPTGKGTGLGLSQVYGFVKQSEGHVKIYSEEGRGTTIKIYLKRAIAASASSGEPVAEVAMPMGAPETHILVVEDSDSVREAAVSTLRELGYTAHAASFGDQALDILDANPHISLLFTDVVMPLMTGRELADIALQRRPDLKVLYTTGYTRNAIVHNGIVDPDVELISKPFTIDQLARKVHRLLSGR